MQPSKLPAPSCGPAVCWAVPPLTAPAPLGRSRRPRPQASRAAKPDGLLALDTSVTVDRLLRQTPICRLPGERRRPGRGAEPGAFVGL
jgi:hypothetical protein